MIHVLLWSIVIVACAPKKDSLKPVNNMARHAEKPVIYQMMTRLFGNKNTNNKFYGTRDENGVGKFSDINDAALDGIRELGVTHVWYTGVLEHASLTDYTAYGIPLDDADVASWAPVFSPDESVLAVAGVDGSVSLWEVAARPIVPV